MQMVESMTEGMRRLFADFQDRASMERCGSAGSIHDEARKVLAWEDIGDEQERREIS